MRHVTTVMYCLEPGRHACSMQVDSQRMMVGKQQVSLGRPAWREGEAHGNAENSCG